MFIESVMIGFSFFACCGGVAKYQTYLIFRQPSPTLDPELGSTHLETVLFMSLYGLFYSLPILSYTVTVMSGRICWPVVVKYLDITSWQAIDTN